MKVAKIFIAALLASGFARAASLEDVQGDVWVGHEKGFTVVRGPEVLSPGDKVKVASKSFARIVYPDGCTVNLRGNSLSTIAKHSPCSFRAQTGGVDQDNSFCSEIGAGQGTNCFGPLALLGGGIGAVATGLALGLTGGESNNNSLLPLLLLAQKPASP